MKNNETLLCVLLNQDEKHMLLSAIEFANGDQNSLWHNKGDSLGSYVFLADKHEMVARKEGADIKIYRRERNDDCKIQIR